MFTELKKIKELYDSGANVMEYFRQKSESGKNTIEAITVSYDLQAGSYIESFNKNQEFNSNYTAAIANVIKGLGGAATLLEAGVGEATTLANVVAKLDAKPTGAGGFDISWSRIKYAKAFCKKQGLTDPWLFTGDLFHIPLMDNSVDIVYTSHSIEPNGGREKEALKELYRISGKYLVLLEPAYELANDEARKRMEHHGYVRGLKQTANELGYKVIEYRLFDHIINPLNPTGLLVIEKDPSSASAQFKPACPITSGKLELRDDCYYCPESLLIYPVAGNIPCLLPSNAILASKFEKTVDV